MDAIKALAPETTIRSACASLSMPRATYYRHQNQRPHAQNRVANKSPLALFPHERDRVLEVLRSDRFVDSSPAEVHATLLDEGSYLCSVRTMYRLLHKTGEVKERRRQRQHQLFYKPELLARRVNEVWSWDITKLKGPVKWTYFYLYVIMDIFSRFIVGWMVAPRESAKLAEALIKESCLNQKIVKEQLTIHADRGSSMRSKQVAFLLADLGVTKSHSRPYQSNDNPYSEAQFKTLKYCPSFPDRFACIADTRSFCADFFRWYNHDHRHSGIAMMTPAVMHNGDAKDVLTNRNRVLVNAFDKHPSRFKNKIPTAMGLPDAAWINKPKKENERGLEH